MPARFFRVMRWIAVVFVLVGGVQVGPEAHADAPPIPAPVPARVQVEMMVVHGTNAHNRVDARLRDVMQHLKFLGYTGFDLLALHREDLSPAQEATFPVAGNRKVKIELLGVDERQAKLHVRMFNSEGKFLDTTVSVHRNRSFMVAGPKLDDGILILPLTVRY